MVFATVKNLCLWNLKTSLACLSSRLESSFDSFPSPLIPSSVIRQTSTVVRARTVKRALRPVRDSWCPNMSPADSTATHTPTHDFSFSCTFQGLGVRWEGSWGSRGLRTRRTTSSSPLWMTKKWESACSCVHSTVLMGYVWQLKAASIRYRVASKKVVKHSMLCRKAALSALSLCSLEEISVHSAASTTSTLLGLLPRAEKKLTPVVSDDTWPRSFPGPTRHASWPMYSGPLTSGWAIL
mmetsp:Transcript_30554/g.76882  ORF Transcript_30554/g.76882 Transcript_30554/m.76882 type:complete len:239 (-) Transcript_30554:47-763(-)